jgi:hypothetical protein
MTTNWGRRTTSRSLFLAVAALAAYAVPALLLQGVQHRRPAGQPPPNSGTPVIDFNVRPPDWTLWLKATPKDRVRRIASIRDPYRVQTPPHVQWRADHKLIICRTRQLIGGASDPEGSYVFGKGFYFAELDPRTGRETPIAGLNEHFPVAASQSIGYWRVSPDGRWLFWPEQTKQRSTWFAARLDGSQIVSWPQPEGEAVGAEFPYYAWTADSRRWVAVVQRGECLDAAIGSLNQPGRVRKVRNVHVIKYYSGYPGHSILGVTPANKAVAAIWDRDEGGTVLLFEFPIDQPRPPTRSYRVSLPPGRGVRDLALSPRGDRLGWVFLSSFKPPLDELWVSRADGTHFARLGEVSYAPLSPMGDENHPRALAWTPDGKSLSFVYKADVCTVAAN